jgi:hypothetical protein
MTHQVFKKDTNGKICVVEPTYWEIVLLGQAMACHIIYRHCEEPQATRQSSSGGTGLLPPAQGRGRNDVTDPNGISAEI